MAKKAPMFEASPTKNLAIDQTNDLPEPLSRDTSLNLDHLALIEPINPLISEQGSLQAQGTELVKPKASLQQNETDRNIPALIQSIGRAVSNREILQASLPNTRQEQTSAKQQPLPAFSDKKPSFSKRNRIADQNQLRASQQEAKHNRKTNASSQVLEETTKAVDQLAPTSQVINTFVTSKLEASKESQSFIAKGGHQVRFQQQVSGQWVAVVVENLPVGISRTLCLPVYLEPGQNIATVCEHNAAWQKNNIHVVFQKPKSYVFVGVTGLLGGMEDPEDERKKSKKKSEKKEKALVTNNNSLSASSGLVSKFKHLLGKSKKSKKKEEALFTNNNSLPAPTDLSSKLKDLYKYDNTLPKLIEDDDISEQSIQDYYVKLQVVLQEDVDQEKRAAAQDKVPGQKKAIEIEKIFDEIDKDHPAAGKVLLLGGAGIGKTTLMHYISYQWANGKLWADKYEHVFRVRLKELLNSDWLTGYTREEKDDLLACFIYSSLNAQKTALEVKGNKQIGKIKYELTDIKQLLEASSKQEKVLLLVDGYDEIAGLKGTSVYQKILDLGVFKHPHVIMTSRPNAASKDIRSKFERQIESQGLDDAGVSQYINQQFNGGDQQELGQELKAFLSSNSQVKGMCEVPINTALLCIIWKDPETRAKLSQSMEIKSRKDFKLGQLYHELIVWLGKRYANRYESAYSSPQAIQELSKKAVFQNKVLKGLERIAYETFTGQGLKEGLKQDKQSGVLVIPGELLDEIAKKEINELTLSELHKYGLLRGEGNPDKPLEQLYSFIHLTFQEYLTAYHLKELLSQKDKDQVQTVAEWIAHHRNEPKYLMTLKFLAGLVSQSQDKLLVQRFWESVSCNVEDILELGLESKVSLLMHLLGQSSMGGKLDERIPNLAQIQELIDEIVVGDMGKWQQDVIESGYLSPRLIEAVSRMMDGAELFKLKVATEIVAGVASKGVFGSREKIYGQLMRLASFSDWQIQKLGLEKAATVLDQTISEPTLRESVQMLMPFLRDENLQGNAIYVLVKLAKIKPELVYDNLQAESSEVKIVVTSELTKIIQIAPKEEFHTLLNLVEQLLDDKDKDVRHSAADALREIIQVAPDKEFPMLLNLVKQLLADQDWEVRYRAANALIEIIQVAPKEELPTLLNLVKPLLADQIPGVRYRAADALKVIIKIAPKEEFHTLLNLVKPLLDDKNVRHSAANALIEIIQVVPKEGFHTLLNLVKQLISNHNFDIRESAAYALSEIIKVAPKEEFHTLLNLFKPLIDDKDLWVRSSAANALIAIIKVAPKEEFHTLLNLFKPLMIADKNNKLRSSVVDALIGIIQVVPKEELLTLLNLFKPLIADKDPDVRFRAANALRNIILVAPKEEFHTLLNLVKPLIAGQDPEVRFRAAYALRDIIQVAPKEELFTLLNLLKPLIADRYTKVRSRAADALSAIIEVAPKEEFHTLLNLFKPLIDDKYWNVRESAADALIKIIKVAPKEEFHTLLNLVKPLIADKDSQVTHSAARALIEIIQVALKEEFHTLLNLVKPLITDQDKHVRVNAALALIAIIKVAPKEEFHTLLNLFKPLLADQDTYTYVRKTAADALSAIIQVAPKEEFHTLLNLLKPLIADQKLYIRSSAADALIAIIKVAPKEEFTTLLNLVKKLLADQDWDIRGRVAYALSAIIQVAPDEELPTLLNLVKLLLADQDSSVRSRAAYALSAIIQVAPDEELPTLLNLLKLLLADQDMYVRNTAANALSKIIEVAPKEEFHTLLNLFKLLIADEDSNVRYSAARALSEIIKVAPDEELPTLLNLLKLLLADQNMYVRNTAADALIAIIKVAPKEEFTILLNLVKMLLADQDPDVRSMAADALSTIIQGLQLSTKLVDLLMDENPQIRETARKGLTAQFKIQEQLAKLDYTHVKLLLRIIDLNQASNEAEQLLQAGANQALSHIAEHIAATGITWLHEHLEELPDTPALRTFLKAVLHQAMSDGKIDDEEAKLFIRCIVKKGITATIDLRGNKIILEDSSYPLEESSKENLMHIVNEVIKSSQDGVAKQYREHTPLFVNSGSALPVATADIKRVGSVVDDVELDSDHWHLSVMHLSDHYKNQPQAVFLLLEQRNYAGEHIIHQITLDKNSFKVVSKAVNPLAVGDIRKDIFREMIYTLYTKPRYYGSSFTLGQALGESLLVECKTQTEPLTDSYTSIHTLAASHVAPTNSNSLPSADLLRMGWFQYVKQPKVMEYKKGNLFQVDAGDSIRLSLEIDRNEQIQAEANAKSNSDFLSVNVPGVDKNHENPIEWYQEAAAKGNAMAQNCLGNSYKYGLDVIQDYKEAVKWYRKAAKQRDRDAQFNLGDMYYYGNGVTQDYKKAERWYQEAAKQGNLEAQFKLGDMYYYGYGVDQDYKESVEWYEKAAKQGHVEAQFKLANMTIMAKE
jgi:HEAT repeat protein